MIAAVILKSRKNHSHADTPFLPPPVLRTVKIAGVFWGFPKEPLAELLCPLALVLKLCPAVYLRSMHRILQRCYRSIAVSPCRIRTFLRWVRIPSGHSIGCTVREGKSYSWQRAACLLAWPRQQRQANRTSLQPTSFRHDNPFSPIDDVSLRAKIVLRCHFRDGAGDFRAARDQVYRVKPLHHRFAGVG
jgi:hypothetical protein